MKARERWWSIRKFAVLALLMLSACGSLTKGAGVGASPASSASPAAVTASPSAAPTDFGPSPTTSPFVPPGPPPVGLNVNCRLPVTWSDAATRYAGFLQFPSETLSEATSAPFPGPRAPIFYDRAYAKWLPVPRDAVSPSGAQYAYADNSGLHVVDVVTGADRSVYSANATWLVAFAAEGIYFSHVSAEGVEQGLWLESPVGGPPRLISSTIYTPNASNGAGWGTSGDTLLRFDLRTGTSTTWWSKPGAHLDIEDGDYSGNLFIDVNMNDGSSGLWVLNSSGAAMEIHVRDQLLDRGPLTFAAVDTNGVWFDLPQVPYSSFWLYARGTIEMVAPSQHETGEIAGGCIPGA